MTGGGEGEGVKSRSLKTASCFRCRSRNRLAYLRKTCTGYEPTAETSEHPLIYDDANINFVSGIRTQPRIPIAHVNSYQLENRMPTQVMIMLGSRIRILKHRVISPVFY